MKSRRTLTALAMLAPLPALAMLPPPPGDFLKSLLAERMRTEGVAGALRHADAQYAATLLDDPGSVYAEVTSTTPAQNELVWEDARDRMAEQGYALSTEEALAIQQWDMGYTKARPGQEAPVVPAAFRAAVIGANAVKAGVEPDIFWKALDLSPYRHYTIGAQYAVAAQMLRERLAAVDAAHPKAEDRTLAYREQGLRKDVYDNFMRARSPGELTDADALYLSRMIDGANNRWAAGSLSVYGNRELPTMFRVARVAAGYAMRQQQVSSTCDEHGVRIGFPDRGAVEPGLLCLNDVTDRAAMRWYADEFQRQRAQVPPHDVSTMERFRHVIGRLIGLAVDVITTVGIPDMEILPTAEFMEMKMASSMVDEGLIASEDAMQAADRTLALTCGVAR